LKLENFVRNHCIFRCSAIASRALRIDNDAARSALAALGSQRDAVRHSTLPGNLSPPIVIRKLPSSFFQYISPSPIDNPKIRFEMNNDRMNNRKFQDLKLIILFDG
jgi:hypothetical protein